MNKNFSNLKEELKAIAVKIKSSKSEYKKQQSKISKEKIDFSISKECIDFFHKHILLENSIFSFKEMYRHKHIAYCLLRGRKYEEIENKVGSGNEPNWNFIKKIQEAYIEAA